ncbi:PadR family transcriptional regulator [Nonomuraea sp. NPDC050790]|uniref:PadR family transcriptional regulator n=1 Tax=Nonomuraea sp. NPDC050790 TaxID=3364371 RepID=UPI0037B9AC26
MSEQTYFVLAALLDGPLHGHAILKRVVELSQDRVKLAVGTLYGALDRLTANGVIMVEKEEIVNGRKRRYFRITDDGRRLVEEEALRMQQAAAVVTRRTLGTTFS